MRGLVVSAVSPLWEKLNIIQWVQCCVCVWGGCCWPEGFVGCRGVLHFDCSVAFLGLNPNATNDTCFTWDMPIFAGHSCDHANSCSKWQAECVERRWRARQQFHGSGAGTAWGCGCIWTWNRGGSTAFLLNIVHRVEGLPVFRNHCNTRPRNCKPTTWFVAVYFQLPE